MQRKINKLVHRVELNDGSGKMTSPEYITLTMGYQKSDGSLYMSCSCSGQPDIVLKRDVPGEWDKFVDGLVAEGKLRLVEDGAVVKVG